MCCVGLGYFLVFILFFVLFCFVWVGGFILLLLLAIMLGFIALRTVWGRNVHRIRQIVNCTIFCSVKSKVSNFAPVTVTSRLKFPEGLFTLPLDPSRCLGQSLFRKDIHHSFGNLAHEFQISGVIDSGKVRISGCGLTFQCP